MVATTAKLGNGSFYVFIDQFSPLVGFPGNNLINCRDFIMGFQPQEVTGFQQDWIQHGLLALEVTKLAVFTPKRSAFALSILMLHDYHRLPPCRVWTCFSWFLAWFPAVFRIKLPVWASFAWKLCGFNMWLGLDWERTMMWVCVNIFITQLWWFW